MNYGVHLDINLDEVPTTYLFSFALYFQDDVFHLVGAPLVENCLAGFNSSVFAYGQVLFGVSCIDMC